MKSPQIDSSLSYLTFLATVSDERLARVAARRAFVELKVHFMRAAALIRGSGGPLVQRQVRLATEVSELWRLRDALFENLPVNDATAMAHRDELQYHLDSAFPAGSASVPLDSKPRRQSPRPR